MNNRSLALGILVTMLAIFASQSNAQHSLQVDDGAGRYGILMANGSMPMGVTNFVFPSTGGTLLTTGSIGGAAWLLTGNAGTTAGTDFVGTTDNMALHLSVRNGATINNSLIFGTNASISREISGTTAGNARGANAVDMQTLRQSALQVASGSAATIGGGRNNRASGPGAVVGGGGWDGSGGAGNDATGPAATVAGGFGNTASGGKSTIGGGANNIATGGLSTVSGGNNNVASNEGAFVGGGGWNGSVGGGNNASGAASTIGGGHANRATDDYGFVGGGQNNRAGDNAGTTTDRPHATVGGGLQNTASGDRSTVGGGNLNTATGTASTIGGGYSNDASGAGSFVGGGGWDGTTADGNTASGNASTVAGGLNTQATGHYSFVGGGVNNVASGLQAAIAGGSSNNVSGQASFIGGGYGNSISGGNSIITGGFGNSIAGGLSAIAGGSGLTLDATAIESFGFLAGNVGSNAMTISAPKTAVFGNTNLWLANNNSTASELRFYEAESGTGAFPSGTKYVALKSPATLTATQTYTLPLDYPTIAGQVLSSDAAGVLSWATTGGGGLVNFTESLTTTAPYSATDAAARLLATNATATNIDVVLQPKGTGGLQAQVADNTATGGNKRGSYAVDWQMIRSSNTQVASGANAIIGGGQNNQASGGGAIVVGGNGNTATGPNTFIGGGGSNIASGNQATIVGGVGNSATAICAFVGAGGRTAGGVVFGNTSSGASSFIGAGYGNTASGDYSAIPGGQNLTLNSVGGFGFNGGATAMTINTNQVSAFANTDLWLANNDNSARQLRFYDAYNASGVFPNTAKHVAFKAPSALTATQTYTLPLDYPSVSGYVLSSTTGGVLSWAVAGGGLTNFTEAINTAAPNATVPVASLTATNAATDVDVALSPKGTGALTAHVADGGIAGGNKRGTYSVDWQRSRNGNNQVAGGSFSVLSGGNKNVATGFTSTIGGGESNTASSSYATVSGGSSNTASGGSATVGGGFSNTASNQYATIGGGNGNTAANSYATVGGGQSNSAGGINATVGGGRNNNASADYSFIPGGTGALASNQGQMAHSAGAFVNNGDAQTSVFVLRKQTTGAAATSLALDGGTAKIAVPTNGAMTFTILIIGKETGGTLGAGNVGSWKIEGVVANNGGAATIIASTVTANNAPATWGVPTVGGSGSSLDIQVTGKAATIDWVARVETVEVVF